MPDAAVEVQDLRKSYGEVTALARGWPPGPSPGAARTSSRRAGGRAPRPTCPGRVLVMPMRRDRGGVAEAVRRLDGAGVGIEDIAVRRPTLNDVFMKLTGRAAEPPDEGNDRREERAA